MKESAGVLQQTKFAALVLKLILVNVIYETRDAHIRASNASGDKEEWEETKFAAYTLLFWVCGFIEFLVIFRGNTLFNNSFNLLQIFIHMFGILLLLGYK